MENQVLSKYRILSELGRGGFATVYRAEDTTLGREVALKVLDPLLMRDEAWVKRFRREARTVAALDHPHIVTIHEIAEAEGRLFIAMKLIAGKSLDKILAEQGPLAWKEVLRTVREVADALSYAHEVGVLHRDLKPGNILLDPRAGAMLTDFGFARLVSQSSMSISLSGGLVGTPHYIAPELWNNQPAGPASDLYALGCVLYEMALGRKAFPGDTSPAVMAAHLLHPLELPEPWPSDVPQGLADVLQAALAREPEARLGRATDFLAALKSLEEDPLAETYTALESAVASEQWEEALQLAGEIRSKQSNYREVVALTERAQAALERMQRERQVAEYKSEATRALKTGQTEVAQTAIQQWLRLQPESAEARALLGETEEMLRAAPSTPVGSEKAGKRSAASRKSEVRTQSQAPARLTPSRTAATPPVQVPASAHSSVRTQSQAQARLTFPHTAATPPAQIPAPIHSIPSTSKDPNTLLTAIKKILFWLGTAIKKILLWLGWVGIGILSSAGWAVGGAIGGTLVEDFALANGDIGRIAGGILGLLVSGSMTAMLQLPVLKSRLRKFGWWALVSVNSWIVGGVMVSVGISLDKGMGAILGGLLNGAISGIFQWLILERDLDRSGWWIVASTLSWAVLGTAVWVVASNVPFSEIVVSQYIWQVRWAISWVIGGMLYGMLSGPVLVWLLFRQPSAQIS